MTTPALYLVLPCAKCGARPGEKCVRLDGTPRSQNHSVRTPPAPCGTYGGYQRHKKRGEQACEACADASRRYKQDRRNARPDERQADIDRLNARRRATRRLIAMHRADFDALLAEENGVP